MLAETVAYRAGLGGDGAGTDADPVTTQVIRHGLVAASDVMRTTLIRTAMSPVIYESHDFTAVLYDRSMRLLAQAASIPLMMGTMSFCIEAAVAEAGGEDALEPGDIILMNDPFKTGSHAQDAALVMPVFLEGAELVGYCAVKAHWLDIGAKSPYCTDSTDLFQEGVVFPGVKLYRAGSRVDDVFRIATANSRLPKFIEGDINAAVAAVRTGARELERLIGRHGFDVFANCVERMFDHGEAVARSYLESLPNGRYVGTGELDNDGVSDEPIVFDVTIEIDGSDVRVDFSAAPDAVGGPVNCPVPSTVAAARVIITMLAGGGGAPNEGYFRPIEVVTRPGSMFHPVSPSPSFLYFQPAMQATEAILAALGEAVPDAVPAGSGGDVCGINWYGTSEESGEFWSTGDLNPIGLGASRRGDGQSCRMHHGVATTRPPAIEVLEAKFPLLALRCELAPDSGGAGRHAGGLGRDMAFRHLEDAFIVAIYERSKRVPWGLAGGLSARPNGATLELVDGTTTAVGKVTGMSAPKGSVFTFHSGGGGGYGPPEERDRDAVLADLRAGYITEAYARRHYPHAHG